MELSFGNIGESRHRLQIIKTTRLSRVKSASGIMVKTKFIVKNPKRANKHKPGDFKPQTISEVWQKYETQGLVISSIGSLQRVETAQTSSRLPRLLKSRQRHAIVQDISRSNFLVEGRQIGAKGYLPRKCF